MMTQEQRTAVSNVLLILGLLFMVVTALLPLINFNQPWMRWGFAVGAFLVLAARSIGAYIGPNLRIRRLHRILILSSILYCASALMMFLSHGINDWLAFLIAGIIVQVYASTMIEIENKKTEK